MSYLPEIERRTIMRKIATILCIFLAVALVAGCASSGGGDKAAGG
jgi:ABC-type Fe3+-citrate transport system substrate-binding protein